MVPRRSDQRGCGASWLTESQNQTICVKRRRLTSSRSVPRSSVLPAAARTGRHSLSCRRRRRWRGYVPGTLTLARRRTSRDEAAARIS